MCSYVPCSGNTLLAIIHGEDGTFMSRYLLTVFAVILGALVCATTTNGQYRITIIDDKGSPIKGAKVTVTCPDDLERKGVSDAKGVFQWIPSYKGNCDVSIRSPQIEDIDAQIFVRGSEAVTVTARRKSKAAAKGTNCPPENRLPGGKCNSTKSLLLLDRESRPIAGAEIFLDCGNFDTQGFADRRGRFYFQTQGSDSCTASIQHPDFDSAEQEIDLTRDPRVEIFTVTLDRGLASGFVVTVLDEESGRPIQGVEIAVSSMNDAWSGATDAAGKAELGSLLVPGGYSITAKHRNYYDASSRVEVPRGVGRVFSTGLSMRKKEHIKTVRVLVVESESDKPIGEADVRLIGDWFSSYSGTTGGDGVAGIPIDRAGRFRIEVTRDNYFPANSVLTVAPGAAESDLQVTVPMAKRQIDPGGSPVKVKVLGQRLDGTTVVLDGAVVTPGEGDPVLTGQDGWATVRFPGYVGDSSSIKVTKAGYDDSSRPVTVPRFSTTVTAPEITITLKEKLTGLKLRIEVSDRDTGKTISGATVNLGKFGSASTDSSGMAEFNLPLDQLSGIASITAVAAANGYTEARSSIAGDVLLPNAEPRYYSIAIRRKYSSATPNPYEVGAVWKLVQGYPRMGDDLANLNKLNPNNAASPGTLSFEHKGGIVSTFTFDTPPDELVWGATVKLSMSGTSLTPADANEASMARISVNDSITVTSSLEGKLKSGKYPNSSFAIFPFMRNQPQDGTWTTSDTITFEFKPRSGASFNIEFCVAWSRSSCFIYSYEPAPQK